MLQVVLDLSGPVEIDLSRADQQFSTYDSLDAKFDQINRYVWVYW